GERLRYAPAARIGRAERSLHELHPLHALRAHDLDRLSVEEELHAFLAAVAVVAPGAGHVVLVAPIGAGDALRPLPDRGAIAVHGGIAATQHEDPQPAHADEGVRGTFEAELTTDVGNEVWQGLVHSRQLFPGKSTAHTGVRAHAEKDGVVGGEQLREGKIATDLASEAKFDAHTLQQLAARLHHLLRQLERRDAEGEESADARLPVEH